GSLRLSGGLLRAGRAPAGGRSPARRGALSLLSVSALAWWRGAHLPPAARGIPRLRPVPVRLFRCRDRGRSRGPAGVLRPHRIGGKDALSRAALVHAGPARSPRVRFPGYAPHLGRAAPRVWLPPSADRIHPPGRIW